VVEDRSGRITISATYSSPKHIIKKEQYINFFKTLGYRFIAAGDYNAKHTHWRLRLILPRELLKVIEAMKLCLQENLPTGYPTTKRLLIY